MTHDAPHGSPLPLTGMAITTPPTSDAAELYVEHREHRSTGPHAHHRPSWDEYFLRIAEVVSSRSQDPDTRHGCVLVDANHRIISTGYNGPIAGIQDETVPTTRPEKYLWFVHAEDNAILFARASLDTATAYITGYPCAACLRRLLQAGVSRIVCGVRSSACITNEERAACEEMARQVSARIEIRP